MSNSNIKHFVIRVYGLVINDNKEVLLTYYGYETRVVFRLSSILETVTELHHSLIPASRVFLQYSGNRF